MTTNRHPTAPTFGQANKVQLDRYFFIVRNWAQRGFIASAQADTAVRLAKHFSRNLSADLVAAGMS